MWCILKIEYRRSGPLWRLPKFYPHMSFPTRGLHQLPWCLQSHSSPSPGLIQPHPWYANASIQTVADTHQTTSEGHQDLSRVCRFLSASEKQSVHLNTGYTTILATPVTEGLWGRAFPHDQVLCQENPVKSEPMQNSRTRHHTVPGHMLREWKPAGIFNISLSQTIVSRCFKPLFVLKKSPSHFSTITI